MFVNILVCKQRNYKYNYIHQYLIYAERLRKKFDFSRAAVAPAQCAPGAVGADAAMAGGTLRKIGNSKECHFPSK